MTALAADPTLDFLRKLDDPSLWIVIPNVPVFKPHKRRLLDGSEVNVTEADLPKIAARCQQRYLRDGVPLRITVGHSLPGKPQEQQPHRVGYGRNVRVGRFGPTAEPCLLAEVRIRKDAWDEAREFCYRSVEYYPDTYDLTGVALLKTDPQLDLGILDPVTYAAVGRHYHYSMEGRMADPTDPPNAATPDNGPKAGPEGVDPGFNENFCRCARHHFPHLYEAGPGMPGAGNAMIPGSGKKEGEQYQRTPATPAAPAPQPDLYAQLQAQLQAERQARQDFQLQYARQECERLCDPLEAAGYQFNRAKAVERLIPLDAAGRQAELQDVIAYSKQAPIGGGFIPTPAGAASINQPRVTTDDESKAAIALCYERGWHDAAGYDRALSEIRGAK